MKYAACYSRQSGVGRQSVIKIKFCVLRLDILLNAAVSQHHYIYLILSEYVIKRYELQGTSVKNCICAAAILCWLG
jgi:hypothetical protein